MVHIKRLQVRSSKPRGTSHARIQRGVGVGHGVQTHTLKITKYRFLSNTDPDPLKKKKKFQANLQCWAITCPPAKHHFNGVLLAG